MSNNPLTDYVGHGFHEIDPKALKIHPPKIKWSSGWYERTDESKLQYLEKLANTMNHAAALLQSERDELGKLCEMKEGQISQLKKAMDQNLAMLQSEVTRLNEDRQETHKAVKVLNNRIRELESQLRVGDTVKSAS